MSEAPSLQSSASDLSLDEPGGGQIRLAQAIDDEARASALAILEKDQKPVQPFFAQKYIREASKSWDKFYKRNTVKFFKDRHWTEREFPELQSTGEKKTLLEVGCGVGNFVFPVLEANPDMFIYCCDFSSRAIEFVKANENYDESRCLAFVCDITQDPLTNTIPAASLDLLSSIFCLSAVPPQKLQDAVNNIGAVMKPGGLVMFRDYGLYDAAQLRFKPGHKIDDNFYVRQDGTFSVYFSIEQLKELFENAGFEAIAIDYVEKEIVNRKRELSMQRRWIQAKFRKL